VNEYSNPESKPRKNTVELPDFAKKGLNKISNFFGQNVAIKMGEKNKGTISIPFHSKEDYKRILKLLDGNQ